jgi:hypothetical protein
MIIEIIPSDGIGRGQPIVIHASQIVVRQDNGTPIYAGAHFGAEKSYVHSIVGADDFNRVLRGLGVNMTVIVNKIAMPGAPAGAKLVASPKEKGVIDGK